MDFGGWTFDVRQTGVSEVTREPVYSVDIDHHKQPWARGCSDRDIEHLTRLTHAATSSPHEMHAAVMLGRTLDGWAEDRGVSVEGATLRCGKFSARPKEMGGVPVITVEREGKLLDALLHDEARDLSDLGKKAGTLFRHMERGQDLDTWIRAEVAKEHAQGRVFEPEREVTR